MKITYIVSNNGHAIISAVAKAIRHIWSVGNNLRAGIHYAAKPDFGTIRYTSKMPAFYIS